ncbi:MAG: UDP-glucose 4-epimerase GalE, partial [Bdellovibrionota bacterium]
RFICSSTATVYAPTDALSIKESAPLRPISPYGESKQLTEQLLQKLHEFEQLSFIALRYFNVAGACLDSQLGQKTKKSTHLIKVAAELAVGKRKYIEIYGDDYQTSDGTAIRDYIHVEDLVEAHVLALQYIKENHSAEFINCGYGQGTTVLEVIEAMEKVSGRKFERRIVGRRLGDTDRLVADTSKARQILGWVPRFDDLEAICRTAYLWEKSLL